jgi:cob(I)alamin adenosyltransferase
MASKIYTRTGDKGKTSLIGGTKVPKNHLRIDSYGTVDELNSFIGLLHDQLKNAGNGLDAGDRAGRDGLAAAAGLLREIQDRMFTIGASLACDPDKAAPQLMIPDLKEEDIKLLEKEIDKMDKALPPLKHFMLPGGHLAVSTAHIARCVCRRAERLCVDMQENNLYIDPIVIRYLNRLSDYLFMLARYAGLLLKVAEIPWKPRL